MTPDQRKLAEALQRVPLALECTDLDIVGKFSLTRIDDGDIHRLADRVIAIRTNQWMAIVDHVHPATALDKRITTELTEYLSDLAIYVYGLGRSRGQSEVYEEAKGLLTTNRTINSKKIVEQKTVKSATTDDDYKIDEGKKIRHQPSAAALWETLEIASAHYIDSHGRLKLPTSLLSK